MRDAPFTKSPLRIMIDNSPTSFDFRYARRYGTEDASLVHVLRRCALPDSGRNTERPDVSRLRTTNRGTTSRTSRDAYCVGFIGVAAGASCLAHETRNGREYRQFSGMTQLDHTLRQIAIAGQPIRDAHVPGFALVPNEPTLVFFS